MSSPINPSVTINMGDGDASLHQPSSKEDRQLMEGRQAPIVNDRGDYKRDYNFRDATKELLVAESGDGNLWSDGSTVNTPFGALSNQEDGKNVQTESTDEMVIVHNMINENVDSDSDVEDNANNDVPPSVLVENEKKYAPSVDERLKSYDPTIDSRLPSTVSLLETPDGGKVYVVGTAHFSLESQQDVAQIVEAVQPDLIVVELCNARVHILYLDEQAIIEESQNLGLRKIHQIIRESGISNGLMYLLMLNMSAHLTKELGMAPGGEFRTAYKEGVKVKNCGVILGDRDINITLKRALSSLTWWQTFKLIFQLMTSSGPCTKEEVEKCKRRDLLEEMLADMTGEFPGVTEVFVKERDMYLTWSLQVAYASAKRNAGDSAGPARIVGVVGMGHIPGIVERWGKVTKADILPILSIPEPSRSSRILRFTIKASLISAVVYVGYKIFFLPSKELLRSSKSVAVEMLKVSGTRWMSTKSSILS